MPTTGFKLFNPKMYINLIVGYYVYGYVICTSVSKIDGPVIKYFRKEVNVNEMFFP